MEHFQPKIRKGLNPRNIPFRRVNTSRFIGKLIYEHDTSSTVNLRIFVSRVDKKI